MKYIELDYQGKNLFTYLELNNILPFKKEIISSNEMQSAFNFLYGNRELFSTIEVSFLLNPENCLNQLSKDIGYLKKDKWKMQFDLMNLDLSTTSTETITDTNKNKVSGYDSDEMIVTDETEKVNVRENKSVQQYVKNVSMLQDKLISDIIFTDIRTLILKNII